MFKTVEELIEDFEFLEDWEERYGYIIELGKELPEMPEEYKNDDNKVPGCLSQVWIVSKLNENGKVEYLVDSDAHIVRGLIAIVMSMFNGKKPEEILNIDAEDILKKFGLEQHLSPNRRNGLFSMIKRMKQDAMTYKES